MGREHPTLSYIEGSLDTAKRSRTHTKMKANFVEMLDD
jgi:hypothetical protein